MTISIIVPVYNVETWLPGCLDSILANDLSGCELILVDDGATDRSGEICEDYAARYPRLIRVIHQENGGLGAARNTGLEAAQSEWLLFVDSDDRIAPNTLDVLRQAAAAGGAQVIGFGYYADDGEHPPVPQDCGFPPAEKPFRLEEHPDYLLSMPNTWARLWKRSLFTDSGVRFPPRVWYEDLRTTAKLLPRSEGILVLPDNLYYYLQRPGSIMNSAKLERNREILEAVDDLIAWYREQGLYERYRNELRAIAAQHALLAGSVRVARADPKHPLLGEIRAHVEDCFPDWKKDPYIRRLPKLKRLALWLVAHRHFRLLQKLFALKG